MAAGMDAAAPPGINDSESFGCPNITYPRLSVFKMYNQETLLRIRVMQAAKTQMNGCDLDILRQHGILSETANRRRRKPKWCKRKQKRGKSARINARLKANPSRPAVPSRPLANIRSLDNKLDEKPTES